ncbi:MAG: metalloregulator ArsR/SmtB family transcription factor [Phycisphaeraceae bacterium]
MKTILTLARALSDESRIRAVMMLRDGELCVCQIIEALKLAPATVSKHMSILHEAGLVERHKRGKWAYYQLVRRGAPPAVRQALRWLFGTLEADTQVARDQKTLCCVRGTDPSDLTGCYSTTSRSWSTTAAASRKRSKSGGKQQRNISKRRK